MYTSNYDIIFTGGGAACRMLLYFLSDKKEFSQLQILVLEAANTTNEKTWCYWGTASNPFEQLACKQWMHLQFEADQNSNKQNIQPFTYSCINGADFNAFFTEQFFSKHTNVTISNELVTAVTKSADEFVVETDSSTYKAPLVFNSIPGLQNNVTQVNMWQHFEGWFIKTDRPCFEDEVASLMNFNDYEGGAFSFLYVLPFSQNEALIEYTFYSGELYPSSVYEERIRQYLLAKNITAYSIIKKEKGKIPLHPENKSTADSVGMIDIGSAGGLVKPSTGYAFQRMMEDCRHIADSFHTPKMIKRRKRSRRFLFYDALLLRIIQEEPARAVSIFKQLFRKQPMQRILTFLNEDSTLLEEIRIFASLPWAPFLRRINFFK
jgi:lycopene beta-cyclase